MGSDVPSMSFGEAHGPVLVRFVDMGVYGTISNSRENEKGSQEGDIFMWLPHQKYLLACPAVNIGD